MNLAKLLLLYISMVSASSLVVTATLTEPMTTSASSSKRAQILATGTPPMFASAKYAIISNNRHLRVPTVSGYLARDVQPTQSSLASPLSPITASSVSVAQSNSVSRTELSVMLLILSVLVACSVL